MTVVLYCLLPRFRELLKAEVAHMLDPPAAVEEEARHLFSALGSA